jgi:flagellar hook-associated protein 2
VNFSRGIADQLNSLSGQFLTFGGNFSLATKTLNKEVSFIDDQRERLTDRLNIIETRFRTQFSNLDILLSRLQSTSSFLTQQLSNL